MAARARSPPPRKREARPAPRRSLRLGNKGVPFKYQEALAYQCSNTSTAMGLATPRTLFRKVLQTQPIVSPMIPPQTDSPRLVNTVQFPSVNDYCSSNEIRLSDPVPNDTPLTAGRKTRAKKKIRLSEFERSVNNHLPTTVAQSLLNDTSLTKSLQISFATPASPHSAGKRGLIRRRMNYKGINVKVFEGSLERNLLRIQGSQNHLQTATMLSNDIDYSTANTELFAVPQLSGQSGCSVLQSQPALTRRFSARRSLRSSGTAVQRTQQSAVSDTDVHGATQSDRGDILAPDLDRTNGTEIVPEEEGLTQREEQQENLHGSEEGLILRNLKEMSALTPSSALVDGVESAPLERAVTPQRGILHGNCRSEHSLCPDKLLASDLDLSSVFSPDDAKLQLGSSLSAPWHEKPSRGPIKEMVAHIIEELDRNVAPSAVMQATPATTFEVEPFVSLQVGHTPTQTPQRTKDKTPSRHVNRQDPEQRERPASKEAVGRKVQEADCGSKAGEAVTVATEDQAVSEDEMDSEVEETSDTENIEPTGKTPAFVHVRAFRLSTLLSTPHSPKVTPSKTPVKKVPKQTKRKPRGKQEPELPQSFIKNAFRHYARMPVAKDAFKAVEKCVNLYFKHLCGDLEAYTNHAGRKTVEPDDVELLMKRQRLITDKMSLNALIERNLPLQYRKQLIPIATSGNKVVPLKPW